MAVTDSSEKRPEWCPPGRSRFVTRPTRPGAQSSSGSSSKRPNSSSSSRHSTSLTTPPSLEPSPRVRRISSNQPSNSQLSRPRSRSPAPDDGAVSETSSPDIHGKHKEPDLEPSQRTQNLSPIFSLPKELFYVRESGQSYEFGLSSGHDILTLKLRLAEEIRMRCQVQHQLDELDALLTKVSEHYDEAQSRANDLEQRLNAALEGQATQQAANQFEAASMLPNVRPKPANPKEFTPENYIWVTQQWERVAEENLRLDNCLHIAGIQKHQLEREIIRLSQEVENYQKPNIGHGKSMIDAAQQTEEEEPTRMTAVATQTEFGDQKDTENGPIEPEYQVVPLKQPRTVTTDAAVQAVEQPDEHMLSNELSGQITKASEVLEVKIQEFGEERLDRKIEVCVKQEDSGQGSSSQTKASKGKGIARETTMAQNEQSSMTRDFELLQPLASNIPQGNGFAGLQYENERLRRENERLRRENDEMRNTLEQHQIEDSRPEGPESHHSHASPEETQVWNTNPGAEVEDADVEMGVMMLDADEIVNDMSGSDYESRGD
ncbi:uncharacterized protein FMAN_14368 [Fusarium mangiferae]|uniref:Uncharacterized protein n=1 Tax=Fusarium mangiferae TaxID=192010 RepID=A0A1L7U9R2_FUSMA|nr:uncharacterized protein FMAN_14368 [Fusarium mangiferae]CVL07450.1 uncharacterized protein FMAN_14368 [Fusarium mangiferae]